MLNLNYEPNIIKSTANLTREEWLKDRRLGIFEDIYHLVDYLLFQLVHL